MNENLINKYVTINNINLVAKKEGIFLEEYESKYIYKLIKDNYYEICYGDVNNIFKLLKDNVKSKTYESVVNLYDKYKRYLKLF